MNTFQETSYNIVNRTKGLVDMARNENQLRRNPRYVNDNERAKIQSLLTMINEKTVFISNHARERLEQRGITAEQVQEVYANAVYDQVAEVSVAPHKGRPTPRILIDGERVYGRGRGRYRVAVVVNALTLELVTTYKAYLSNNYDEIQNDDFDFSELF